MNLKIFMVWLNDGGWHTDGIPKEIVIAKDEEDAINVALAMKDGLYNRLYKAVDCYATELKINGYKIIIEKE